MELLVRGVEMFGTGKVYAQTRIKWKRITPYMPKSAITMSESGAFVRYKIFSGLAGFWSAE